MSAFFVYQVTEVMHWQDRNGVLFGNLSLCHVEHVVGSLRANLPYDFLKLVNLSCHEKASDVIPVVSCCCGLFGRTWCTPRKNE